MIINIDKNWKELVTVADATYYIQNLSSNVLQISDDVTDTADGLRIGYLDGVKVKGGTWSVKTVDGRGQIVLMKTE